MRNQHYFTRFIGAITLTCFFTSCATIEKMPETERVDNREGTGPIVVTEGRVQGTFRSVAGVMDRLSCYCNNGGYVTSPDGGMTAVCFEDTQDVGACLEIEASGIFETKMLDSEGNNPCPSGEMSFLHVKDYNCLTTKK